MSSPPKETAPPGKKRRIKENMVSGTETGRNERSNYMTRSLSDSSIVSPLGIVGVAGSEVAIFNDNDDGKWTLLPEYNYTESGDAFFVHATFAEDGKTRRVYIMGPTGAAILDIGDANWTYVIEPTGIRRTDAAAALLDEDTILICGGEMQRKDVKTCLLFNMKSRTWSFDVPDMQACRVMHSCVHYKGDIVVIGSRGKNIFSCERFDTATGTWGPFPALTESATSRSASVVGDRIYAIAWFSFHIYDGTAWSCAKYDPSVAGPLILTTPLSGTIICFSYVSERVARYTADANELSVFTTAPLVAPDCVSSF